jgi:hypothetical protein
MPTQPDAREAPKNRTFWQPANFLVFFLPTVPSISTVLFAAPNRIHKFFETKIDPFFQFHDKRHCNKNGKKIERGEEQTTVNSPTLYALIFTLPIGGIAQQQQKTQATTSAKPAEPAKETKHNLNFDPIMVHLYVHCM